MLDFKVFYGKMSNEKGSIIHKIIIIHNLYIIIVQCQNIPW